TAVSDGFCPRPASWPCLRSQPNSEKPNSRPPPATAPAFSSVRREFDVLFSMCAPQSAFQSAFTGGGRFGGGRHGRGREAGGDLDRVADAAIGAAAADVA